MKELDLSWNKHLTIWGIAISLIYLIGMFCIVIMDVDAAQYASISREMFSSGQFLQIKHKYADYLDKPPLLFWLSALSYSIFGVNQFAFRLPSVLSTLLGIYATSRLGKKLYGESTGKLAALFLASSQAYFLFNHDIRTDTLLANFVIFAIWQLFEYIDSKNWRYFVGGFVGIGLAMLAKGPIGIVIPAAALGAYLLGQGNWRMIFHLPWIAGIAIIGIVLSPMLYGLYLQFGSEGLYFYFWKQSFGRITGENVWHDNSGPFFFVHTFLWSFLPWALLAVWAILKGFAQFWKKGYSIDLLCLGGFVLPFIALSMSHYKLPHYIFPMYSLIAILAAKEFIQIQENANKWLQNSFWGLHAIIAFASLAAGFLLLWAVFEAHWSLWLLWGLGLAATLYYYLNKKWVEMRLVAPILVAFLTVNAILNLHFYPKLLEYQSGSQVAFFVQKHQIPVEELCVYNVYPNSIDFYTKNISTVLGISEAIQLVSQEAVWIYTDSKGLQNLENGGAVIEKKIPFQHINVTKLSLKFLNPNTREKTLSTYYLLRVNGVVG